MKNCFEKFRYWYIIFMMYAIFGWCYEVFLEVVVYKWGFTNRGVLFGPYCPVYGVGAMAFIILIYPLIKKKEFRKRLLFIPLVFIGCMLIATAIELAASYLLEAATGSWPWQTYADYKYNFQARVALSPSLRFGLGGVLFLYVLQPAFEKLMEKLGKKKDILFYVVFGLFAIDLIVFIIKTIA